MAYVTRIIANCKREFDLELAPRTLVVGDNRTGKSAIASALELLLMGGTHDLGTVPSILMRLAPTRSEVLRVEGHLSDGTRSVFDLRGSTSRAHKPRLSEGAGALGVLVDERLRELLLGRSERAVRQGLLRLTGAGGDDALEAITQELPKAFQDDWRALIASARADVEEEGAADLVVAAQRLCAKRKREAAKSAKAAAEALREAAGGFGAVEERRLRDLRERTEGDARREATEAAAREMRERLDTSETQAPPSDLVAKLPMLPAIDHALAVVAAHRDLRRESCLVCGADLGDPAHAQEARLQVAAARLREARARHDAAGNRERWRSQLAAFDALLATPPLSAGERQELAELDARRVARDLEATRRATAVEAERQVLAYEALGKLLDRAVRELVGGAVERFRDGVTRYLGNDERLLLQLFDGEKAVCRVGLESAARGVRAYEVLSGAERAAVVAAMARAEAARWPQARVRLLVIDEVALTPTTARGLCRVLGPVGSDGDPLTQAIVFLAVEGEVEAAEGWKIVRLAEGGLSNE